MSFEIWCYLLPLLVGFGLPAMLAWRPGLEGIRPASLLLAVLFSITLALSCFAAPPPWATAKILLFTLAFSLFVAGLHASMGQIATGIVVTAMMGTLFYFTRAVDDSLPAATITSRIELALNVNPYAVMTAFFGRDVLHLDTIYRTTHFADYIVTYPVWTRVATVYVLAGVPLLAGGIYLRRLTK